MIKFYFNKKAMEALAKELRRASWGVGVIFSAGGYSLNKPWVFFSGGVFWLTLQIFALVLESLHDDSEGV